MKRLILALTIFLAPAVCSALDAEFPLNFKPSRYIVNNTTVAFSSSTALALTQTNAGAYWEVTISSSAFLYRYTVNGSSANIATVGLPVAVGTERTIKGNNKIWILQGAGSTAETRPIETIEPVR